MAKVSPTQRALAECRRRGWTAQVVEKWNPHSRTRADLFGMFDILAIAPDPECGICPGTHPGQLLGIQVTSDAHHAERIEKLRGNATLAQWLATGARAVVWSYGKRGARGKRKTWALREESLQSLVDGTTASQAPGSDARRDGHGADGPAPSGSDGRGPQEGAQRDDPPQDRGQDRGVAGQRGSRSGARRDRPGVEAPAGRQQRLAAPHGSG